MGFEPQSTGGEFRGLNTTLSIYDVVFRLPMKGKFDG